MNSPLPLKRMHFALGVALTVLIASLFAPLDLSRPGVAWAAEKEGAYVPPAERVTGRAVLAGEPRRDAPETVGPQLVVQYSPEQIVLNDARGHLVINLAGKTVRVVDANNRQVAGEANLAGAMVTVITRGQDVSIMVMPKREVTDGTAK